MPETAKQKPSVGRIVLYRNQDEVDIAAIITGLIGDLDRVPPGVAQGGDRVHLEMFVPPTTRPAYVSPEYGVPRSDEPAAGCWRWPERI